MAADFLLNGTANLLDPALNTNDFAKDNKFSSKKLKAYIPKSFTEKFGNIP